MNIYRIFSLDYYSSTKSIAKLCTRDDNTFAYLHHQLDPRYWRPPATTSVLSAQLDQLLVEVLLPIAMNWSFNLGIALLRILKIGNRRGALRALVERKEKTVAAAR